LMPTRSNACSELTRFWLEARHGCLVSEGVPVPVPYALSDIDLVAMHPKGDTITLPGGTEVGPRIIVETKDEHDFDPTGREFAKYLRSDIDKLGTNPFIPLGTKDVKFTMLREQHFRRATDLFGTDDFDRLFVVHAIDPAALAALTPELKPRRIYWLTVPALVRDLFDWYQTHPRPSGLRNTLTGDLWHLLVGYCKLELPVK
jgi:hypothetical protein